MSCYNYFYKPPVIEAHVYNMSAKQTTSTGNVDLGLPPPYSEDKSDESPAYHQILTSHPALRSPYLSLHDVMRVRRLEDSLPTVFDKTMQQLTFAKYKKMVGQKPEKDEYRRKAFEDGGLIRTTIKQKDFSYEMATYFRLVGSTMDELWKRLVKHRAHETALQPCSHLTCHWHPNLRLFYVKDMKDMSQWCFYEKSSQLYLLRFYVTHDLGPLHGPDDEEWVRLSAVPSAVRFAEPKARRVEHREKSSACTLM